jgi:hypothetical protein
MPPTSRKPTRRRPVPPRSGAAPAAPYEPLRFTTGDSTPEKREPLFYIDDTEYTMLADPPASIGLTAMKIEAEMVDELTAAGATVQVASMKAAGKAQDYIMRRMLGDDGYEALCGYEKLTGSELRQIIEICATKVYSVLEDEDNPNR